MVLINVMTPAELVPLANGLAQSCISLARFIGTSLISPTPNGRQLTDVVQVLSSEAPSSLPALRTRKTLDRPSDST